MSRYAHEPYGRRVIVQMGSACPLRCAHCIVHAGPDRSDELDTERLVSLIADLARGRTRRIVLTGGEPFLHRDRLHRAIAAAHASELDVDVVTSAAWARSPAVAAATLAALPAPIALSISASPHHLAFQAVDRLRYAAQAARDRGWPVGLFVSVAHDDDPFPAALRAAVGPLAEELEWLEQPVHLAGRGASDPGLIEAVPRVDAAALEALPCPLPAAPVVLPDGRVMACCGDVVSDPDEWGALQLGHLDEQAVGEALASGSRHALAQALRLYGPVGLARRAEAEAGRTILSGSFERDNPCAPCRVATRDPDVLALVSAMERSGELAVLRLTLLGEVHG